MTTKITPPPAWGNEVKKDPTEAGGDDASRSLIHVIALMVGEADKQDPPTLHCSGILERAKAIGMLEVIVGFTLDPKKMLGWRLKKLKGRLLLDSQRRRFEFGRRSMAAGASYPIGFL